MNKKLLHSALLGISMAAAVALQGCNGGGSDSSASSSGVGSGGSGYSTGTVTGFGSVVVDGVHIDDRNASAYVDLSTGDTEATDVKLGQRVEVETEKEGVAKSIHVMAEVIGLVQSVDSAGQKLVVAGQTVLINTDANKGPVTVYDGYTALTDVQIGDAVEIHGIPLADAGTGSVQIQATRIEKKTAPLSFVRVSSKVSSLSTASKTFLLGSLTVDYSTATIVPASRQLAEGQRVVVFGPSVSGNTLSARVIRIAEPKAKGVSAQVGGVVSKYDSTALTFEVNGVKINAKNAVIVPAGRTISNNAYVRVKGSYADSGELLASQVEIRRKADTDFVVEVSLKGSVTDYVSLSSFKVRGVPVDASTAQLSNCSAGLSNGLYVEAEGNVSKTGITATKVSCKDAPEAAEIEIKGSAGSLNLTARTFVLTSGSKTYTVQWGSLTRFIGIVAASLSGAQVEVEGYLQNGTLIAKKIGTNK